jgi:hypothetical protein
MREAGTTGLKVDRKVSADGTVSIILGGTIDERTDLESVFKSLSGPITFNLRGIERINSIGIARWIATFSDYTHRFSAIVEEVSYPIAVQANAISNLLGAAKVKSCLAPYYCSRCSQNFMVVVTAADVAAASGAIPEKRCTTCKSIMPFDDLDNYFSFIGAP